MTGSISRLLGRATEILREGETDTARLDAEVLLAHQLGKGRAWLLAHPDNVLADAESEAFFRQVGERARGMPVAYLVGHREFWSMRLQVTPDVLIPRPETELLVEQGLARLPAGASRILDLGTGCGAIALAVARERPESRITAVDRSLPAIGVARLNAARLGAANVRLLVSDWFCAVAGEKFDLVLANPPYVDANDPCLLGEVRHEPADALVAGNGGLADLGTVIASAPPFIVPGGHLLLEHGHEQAAAVAGMFGDAGFVRVETLHDLAGLPRVTCGRLAGC